MGLLKVKMEKFCRFLTHEYMDKSPCIHIRTFKGETLEDVEDNARKWAIEMTKNYSGGPTTFVKVLTKEEAREWIDSEWNSIRWPDEFDLEWLNRVNTIYDECYGNT